MTKPELKDHIYYSFEEVKQWYLQSPTQNFDVVFKQGKWTAGQHLEHLILSWEALSKAMKVPKFLLAYKFGKCNREERELNTIVEKYNTKLDGNPAITTKRFEPSLLSSEHKQDALFRFGHVEDQIIKKIDKWSEKNLSTYLIPHPLMGRITVREILAWSGYHNRHHLRTLERDY